jgi:glycerophosphoryl diester phosphodiesterase
MAAFAHAVDLGFRYLETDVHVTADGVLVAFHDPDLRRTCGLDARIADLPWDELAAARVDGREPIPRMRDLLEAFPEVRLNIDAKADGAVPPLVELVVAHDAVDRVCLGSFSIRRIRRIRRALGRRALTAMVTPEVAALKLFGRRVSGGPLAAQVPVAFGRVTVLDEQFVARAHRNEVPVHVWTIDDPGEMHRLLDLGVDGIMTDRPDVLRDVYIERDIWQA